VATIEAQATVTGARWFLGGMMALAVVIVPFLFRARPPASAPHGQPGAVHA
jgi:hypothetical protein